MTLPNQLTNGHPADADEVMENFEFLQQKLIDSLPKTYVQYYTADLTVGTTFANITTPVTVTIRDGFDFSIATEIPMRGQGTGYWGGGYQKILIAINGGSNIDLGHTGHSDVMVSNNIEMIGRSFKKLLIKRSELSQIPNEGDFELTVTIQARSYDNTMRVNGGNGISGDRYKTQVTIKEENSVNLV